MINAFNEGYVLGFEEKKAHHGLATFKLPTST